MVLRVEGLGFRGQDLCRRSKHWAEGMARWLPKEMRELQAQRLWREIAWVCNVLRS